MNERRLEILQQVERGEISTAQGARLLSLLEDGRLPERIEHTDDRPEAGVDASLSPSEPQVETAPDLADPDASWRQWKWLPFGLSVLLTLVASIWIYQGWDARRFGIGFWLAWFPFLLGVAGMALTWRLHWLHLRVQDISKSNRPVVFALHIPLPFGLAGWVMRTFGRFTPVSDPAQRDAIASILESDFPSDGPVQIFIDEDDTKVEIVIE